MNVTGLLVCAGLAMSEGPLTPREHLAAARTWVYQLQKAEIEPLTRATADVVVVDVLHDSGQPWTPDEIALVKHRADQGPRVVLAYVSVGEAEDYRPYWRPEWHTTRPDFIGPVNPRWKGNYPAKFWMESWREIVLGPSGLVRTAFACGFDGIYLDRIDVYEEWGPAGVGEARMADNAGAMVSFIRDIAQVARQARPDALVVPQNAWPLFSDPALLDVIDGVGLENVFYFGPHAHRKAHTEAVLTGIEPVKDRGLPIFSIDYTTRHLRGRYVKKARAAGFVPYPAPSQALDRLPTERPRDKHGP